GRAGAFRAPTNGTEVARVGDAVEAREQRSLDAGELICVRIAEGLDTRDDPLMVARTRKLGQRALGSYLDPRPFLQPRLQAHGTLACVDLEHVAGPAHSLADGTAAVDEIRRHGLGTRR